MSEEKEEAIQHLSAIKSALVDKDVFFPITTMHFWFGVP